MADKMVKLYFHWTLAEVGLYKPATLVPQSLNGSSVLVVVEVPASLEYIENYDKLLTQEVYAETNERPMLTTKGFKYALDKLQTALDNGSAKVEPDTDENLEYID